MEDAVSRVVVPVVMMEVRVGVVFVGENECRDVLGGSHYFRSNSTRYTIGNRDRIGCCTVCTTQRALRQHGKNSKRKTASDKGGQSSLCGKCLNSQEDDMTLGRALESQLHLR